MMKLVSETVPLDDFQAGHENGWHAALFIYGLRDCTIRNDSDQVMQIPVGRREAYLDLAPGEQATIRTVEPLEWPCDGEAERSMRSV